MRRYVVEVDGYGPEEFEAPTASKARYRAYVAFADAVCRIPFRDFLGRVRTADVGPASQTRQESLDA
jgi:uncharacterized protein YfaP (DUF2135 family)